MANCIEDNATPTPLVFRLVLVLIKIVITNAYENFHPEFNSILYHHFANYTTLESFKNVSNKYNTYYTKIRISDCKKNLKDEVKK